jgi:hypothetical protein
MSEPKGHDDVSPLTVHEAKQASQSMEGQIAAVVPQIHTARIDQGQAGILLNCSPRESYQWTGQTLLTLTGQPDIDSVLREIETHWTETKDYRVERRIAGDGSPEVDIYGPYGEVYLIGPWNNATQSQILSFSPCVKYEKGYIASDTV